MPPHSRLRFDGFEFDSAAGELWADGLRVPLQPQPARLLEMLLARPGEVVSREEIRAALWADGVHVDFDRSLNFCVAKLRSAIGDNAAEPQFVETVPTRGYRFIAATVREGRSGAERADNAAAKCTEHTDHGAAAERADHERRSATESTDHTEDERRLRAYIVYAGVALAVVAVIAVRVFQMAPGTPKVVVVPFHNETGSPDLDRLAKGVSDATVVKLAESGGLKVIGNATGLSLSFRPPDMKAMGEALGAQYLVLGQMKRDDRRMRIVAHLIRVSDQTHVWAKTYDTDTLDLPQQSTIAREIAAAVALRIGKG